MTRPEHDIEYERRFLVEELPIRQMTASERIVQGYIWAENGYAVRARRTWVIEADTEHETTAILTVKGPRSGHQRWEQEIAIPSHHAQAMIDRSLGVIEKTRYGVVSEGNTWIVDVFHGLNNGLIIAEFEASQHIVATIKAPWWCGPEITSDLRYNNENLAVNPWPKWAER